MMTFFRRIDLSSRPLLLLCGSEGSGKTTLLTKSGVACEYLYPDDQSMSRRDAPAWFFSENAVYVLGVSGAGQMPQPENKEQAQTGGKKQKKSRKKKQAAPMSRQEAFYTELRKNRLWRRRAIDGVLFVVDVNDIIKSDEMRINKIAADLRGQADAIVSMTGFRIPVYFILNKTDKIEGFRELFSDKSIVERMPCVGSLVYGDGSSKLSPKELFSSQYKKMYDVLTDMCVLGTVNANRHELLEKQPGTLDDRIELSQASRHEPVKTGVAGERAAIGRLTQDFLLAESKISAFIETFFVDRGRDRPLLGGFFFTSSMMEKAGEPDKPAAFSNHVLLGEVIPGAKHSIKEAGEGTLFHRVKTGCRYLFIFLLFIIISALIPGSGFRDARHIRATMAELSALLEAEPTTENQYAALTTLLQSYEFLQKKYVLPGRVIFGTGKVCAAVKDVYLAVAREILVKPTAERLEASIQQRVERGGEPTADEHQRLYRSLETYLLLTGGYPSNAKSFDVAAVTEVIERSLKMSIGQQYNSMDPKAIQNNIRAVIGFAANGSLSVSPSEGVIAAAREKLARTPRVETVYAATMERLRVSRRTIPMDRVAGKSEIVQYDREVSTLYTREGWEQTVYAALIDASKDPFKNDWVTGPTKVSVDEGKLLSEMLTLYVNDLRNRWLGFIRAASINLPSDMTAFVGDLEKLSSQKSEVGRTLAVACSLATQTPLDVNIDPSKKKSASDIKGQLSGITNKLRGDLMNLTQKMPDPFVEAKITFGPIDEFLTGDGFLKYRNGLSELSKTMKQCAERGGFVAAFASRGENPISQARRNLAIAYANIPSEASPVVKRLLEAPLDHAAAVLAKAVSVELEEAWSGEVAKYFNEKLSARYPFDRNAPDVPYSDFEEFFKPQSGVLWKHIDKNLTGFIERTSNGWAPVATPQLLVFVSDEALHSINRADKIATAFFRNDGMSQQDISFSPFTSSFGSVRFSIGEKTFDFSGGFPVTASRTSGTAETIILRVTSAGKDASELRFAGEWSLAHLFDAAKIEPMGRGRYNARWSVNVQNIYTAHITSVVQSNAAALFDESITKGFNVPARVLRERR
jgi:type VI protein secretion system component VasK